MSLQFRLPRWCRRWGPLILVPLLSACGQEVLPLVDIQKSLSSVPTYSIVLSDMKEEGNFFSSFYHKYKIVTPDLNRETVWREVPRQYYEQNQSLLGMALAGMKDGEPLGIPVPAAYMYVGDPRYGSWRMDPGGREIWAFNPGNALFDELDIDLHYPITRSYYDGYRNARTQKVPFFGLNKEYGTDGSVTQKAKPDFFQRRMAKAQAQSASFTEKFSSRIGRTRTTARSRSGSSGK